MSVTLFGEEWNPQLVFDDQGRSSLFWEDKLFFATERCRELTVREKNGLFAAWEAALAEPVSFQTGGIASFYLPSRQYVYVLKSVDELRDKPLLREAIVTTMRVGITQYGERFRKFVESHPLGALDHNTAVFENGRKAGSMSSPDAGAQAYTHEDIDEAWRAVDELSIWVGA